MWRRDPIGLDLLQISNRIISAYGREGLRLLERAPLLQAGIDAVDAELLSTVGIPREEQLQISFNQAHELPNLRDIAKRKLGAPPNWSRDVVCLNEKYGVVIGVDKGSGGDVVAIDLKGKMPERFVNSRIRYLVGFMAECVLHWHRWTNGEISKEQSLETSRQWMLEVDSRALREGTWWDLVLEQMQAGLL